MLMGGGSGATVGGTDIRQAAGREEAGGINHSRKAARRRAFKIRSSGFLRALSQVPQRPGKRLPWGHFKESNSRAFNLSLAASAGFQNQPLVSQHWAKESFSTSVL